MDSMPFVSVIIATRNEERYIEKCLQSLVQQTYPRDKFEVLVVDGLSEDKTLSIVGSFSEKLSLRVFENPKVSQVFGLNLAIGEALGEYLLLVGGHSFVERDFIERNVAVFFQIAEKEPLLAVVGGSLNLVYGNSYAELFSSVYSSQFSGASSFWYSKNPHFAKTVAFGLYRKEFVKKVGTFDEDMLSGDDFELNSRLVKAGFKIYYDPAIMSSYYVRSSFSGFLTQSLKYGAAKGLCLRKGYVNPVWFVPSCFLIYEFALLGALFVRNWQLLTALAIPFALYWIISIAACLRFFRRKLVSALLPVTFWVFHNVVGFGFLMGALIGRKSLQVILRNRNKALRNTSDVK
jgi:glycosyltransferase involved in cell wall biosynthesis